MITFIAHLHVPPANAQAFEELMTHVATMSNDETGVVYYGFAKSVDEADTYSVVEVYRDQAACTSHGETDWVRESVPKSLLLIDGMPRLAQYVSPGAEPVDSKFEELT
jgi:quinol monooxygenase YgiN